jgi:hypothetical protein
MRLNDSNPPPRKTRRDLLLAIAERIGGERGRRMRDAVRNSAFAHLLDRPLTEEEFTTQLANAERDLPAALETFEDLGPEVHSWGFPN